MILGGMFYIVIHNKVCQNKCKGANEGWNASEYGCDIISTIVHKCSECGCKDEKHRFRDYI